MFGALSLLNWLIFLADTLDLPVESENVSGFQIDFCFLIWLLKIYSSLKKASTTQNKDLIKKCGKHDSNPWLQILQKQTIWRPETSSNITWMNMLPKRQHSNNEKVSHQLQPVYLISPCPDWLNKCLTKLFFGVCQSSIEKSNGNRP